MCGVGWCGCCTATGSLARHKLSGRLQLNELPVLRTLQCYCMSLRVGSNVRCVFHVCEACALEVLAAVRDPLPGEACGHGRATLNGS
jgi:hypothetical protein